MPALPAHPVGVALAAGLCSRGAGSLAGAGRRAGRCDHREARSELEKQVAAGMRAFSVPGVAIGIVH